MRPGGLIVADNVLRHGRVLDAQTDDPSVTGMREFNDRVASDPRVEAVDAHRARRHHAHPRP